MTDGSATSAVSRESIDNEIKSLVTIEVAERLAVSAYQAIEAGDIEEAKRLLVALTGETSARTCTAVNLQKVSDAISQRASAAVARVMESRPVSVQVQGGRRLRAASAEGWDYEQHGLIGRPDRPGGV